MASPTLNQVHIPGAMNQPKKPVQKPWTSATVPANLKDWPEEKRAIFAEVANKVLAQTGDEEQAVRAGIAAANKAVGKSWLAKNHAYSGAMVALFVPEQAAEALEMPGGLEDKELHITLAYLGKAAKIKDVGAIQKALERFAGQRGPLAISVGGIGKFAKVEEGRQPFYASADSPDLPGFRQDLVQALGHKDGEHGFTPHITLCYVPVGSPLPTPDLPPVSFIVQAVSLCVGGARWDYPLTGVNKARYAKALCMACKARPPTKDILWANGKGHAWFCDGCYGQWASEHGGDIDRVSYIPDGSAHVRRRAVRQSLRSKSVNKDTVLKINGLPVPLAKMARLWVAFTKAESEREELKQAQQTIEVKKWELQIVAKATEKQLAYGLILRPDVADTQGDIYTAEEVEKAAHWYAAHSFGKADWEHKKELPRTDAVLVESWIAPAEFEWNGFQVLKGDWMGAMWIRDKDKWEAVKKGDIQAFSIRGQGRRRELG